MFDFEIIKIRHLEGAKSALVDDILFACYGSTGDSRLSSGYYLVKLTLTNNSISKLCNICNFHFFVQCFVDHL